MGGHAPKVDVEEVPILTQHKVVKVTVADPEKVCDDAIPRRTFNICVHHVLADTERPVLVRVVLAKVRSDVAMVFEHSGKWQRVGDKLKHTNL